MQTLIYMGKSEKATCEVIDSYVGVRTTKWQAYNRVLHVGRHQQYQESL